MLQYTLAGAGGNVNPNLRLIDNAFEFDDAKINWNWCYNSN